MEGGIAILDREALKAKFLGCFAARTTSAQTLPEVVKILLQLGVVHDLAARIAPIGHGLRRTCTGKGGARGRACSLADRAAGCACAQALRLCRQLEPLAQAAPSIACVVRTPHASSPSHPTHKAATAQQLDGHMLARDAIDSMHHLAVAAGPQLCLLRAGGVAACRVPLS